MDAIIIGSGAHHRVEECPSALECRGGTPRIAAHLMCPARIQCGGDEELLSVEYRSVDSLDESEKAIRLPLPEEQQDTLSRTCSQLAERRLVGNARQRRA